jgi:hypothetical protein
VTLPRPARGLKTSCRRISPAQSTIQPVSGVQADSPPPTSSTGGKVPLPCGDADHILVTAPRRIASFRGLPRPGCSLEADTCVRFTRHRVGLASRSAQARDRWRASIVILMPNAVLERLVDQSKAPSGCRRDLYRDRRHASRTADLDLPCRWHGGRSERARCRTALILTGPSSGTSDTRPESRSPRLPAP